jgi:hypothetical protein
MAEIVRVHVARVGIIRGVRETRGVDPAGGTDLASHQRVVVRASACLFESHVGVSERRREIGIGASLLLGCWGVFSTATPTA